MFNKSDKSLYLVRKIVNVSLFVMMCLSVLGGIVLIAMSFPVYEGYGLWINFFTLFGGIGAIVVGPILLQLVYLVFDIKFNALLDVKNIRNTGYGLPAEQFDGPLFFNKCKSKNACSIQNRIDAYDKIKQYKNLFDEGVITEREFNDIKSELLGNSFAQAKQFDGNVNKLKSLKGFVDEGILTEDEFTQEKSKILKN